MVKTKAGGLRALASKEIRDEVVSVLRARHYGSAPPPGLRPLSGPALQSSLSISSFDISIDFSSVPPSEVDRRRTDGIELGGRISQQFPIETRSKILGIELTSKSTLVDDSGKPVLEQYQFLARDAI